MLGYGDHESRRTLLDELSDIWPETLARPYLKSVIGYREVIGLCDQDSIEPTQLTGIQARLWRFRVIDAIYAALLAYSRDQHRAISAAIDTMHDFAVEVHER